MIHTRFADVIDKDNVRSAIEIIQNNGKKRRIVQMNSVDRLLLRCILLSVQGDVETLRRDECFAYMSSIP